MTRVIMPAVTTRSKVSPNKGTAWRRIRLILLLIPVGYLVFCVALTVLLRFIAPPFSMLMIERRVEAWRTGQKYSPQYKWVDFDRIAPSMRLAVIASEDQNFTQHHGFDWQAIQRAIDYDENGKRVRGASTISQQTAKNLFLWPERDWLRKGFEAYFTVLLESCWDKHRILETYLNIVEFGDGIYGVEAAAEQYFHKPAARLSAEEAALLAAVLPNPHRLKANAPSAYVRERQQWILQQMGHLKSD
ncbi:MAG TPA: monofunctional biosynthetic peptidoglycan transglycosylase [Terriglobia bacterium]|nr:monofunctional biosynthetic peptidoglycan transglycosylase [Terriglobia bacterium]